MDTTKITQQAAKIIARTYGPDNATETTARAIINMVATETAAMDPFEAALREARTRWENTEDIRSVHARLSKQADARGDETVRRYHFREATKLQNEMIKYADAISALTKITESFK